MTRTQAETEMEGTGIQVERLMVGAEVISVGEEQIAVGFPEEVVKAWMRAGKSPSAWLIPDVRVVDGIVQWALEFPLYFALFVQGKFGRGERIRVVVKRSDWPDVLDYLRLTLLGLTEKELLAAGVDKARARMIRNEGKYLALKHPDGSVAQVTDFLEPIFFDDEGLAELGGVQIKTHGANTWSFYTQDDRIEEYRLEIDEAQTPPYSEPLHPSNAPLLPQPFEVITLGAANGFDVSGPCSNLLVQANGRFVLIDAGPYIRTLLNHAGVSLNQVSALVLTHAHEDHAVGLSALLGLTHRIKLYLSRENAEIMRRKLALLNPGLAEPERLLDEAFEVIPVEPGQDHDLMGLKMRFHYTFHAIPCTGVELSMREGNTKRRVLVVGDHNSRANVRQAAEAGVVGPARLAEMEALYDFDGDLLIADAGAGQIHGMPADFHDSPAAAVVCVHTGALAEGDRHLYSLAKAGHRYTIIPEAARPTPLERGLAHRALTEAFGEPEGDGADRLQAMLDAAMPMSANRGHVVVRHRDTSRDLYVTLTGELSVVAEADGQIRPVAAIHAGEVFGEMAVVNGAPRSASVLAATPARLLRIPAEAFEEFARETKLAERLPALWAKRHDLESAGILATASVTTRNRFAHHAVRKTIAPGATLIREGSKSNTVFVLVQGRVQVYKGTEPLMVDGRPVIVAPGALLGETAPFLKQARNASIVTVDECEVLAIRGTDFKRIVNLSPQLFCNISRVVRERQAA